MCNHLDYEQQIPTGKRFRLAGVLASDGRGYRICIADGMRWRVTAPDDLSSLVGRDVVAEGVFAEPTLLAADYVGAAAQ